MNRIASIIGIGALLLASSCNSPKQTMTDTTSSTEKHLLTRKMLKLNSQEQIHLKLQMQS